jgi:hypothetical protein
MSYVCFFISRVPGHFRVFQALKSLGNQAAASKKKHQLALYEHYADNMPCPAIAGLAIRWLSLLEFQLVYSTVRLQEVLRRLAASPPDTLLAQASLVPFLGGQFLMVGTVVHVEIDVGIDVGIDIVHCSICPNWPYPYYYCYYSF